ncbi:hypothetical protein D3C77_251420 [compost metagenome]
MEFLERIKADRQQKRLIEEQIKRIEQFSKVIPEQTVEMELLGYVPEEVKTLEQAEQWLAVLQTAQLRRKAERYGVEMPDSSDRELGQRMDWDDDQDEPYFLTSKGMRQVNMAIREEDKYRWDKWNTRISATIAPLSLIVAIMALWLD